MTALLAIAKGIDEKYQYPIMLCYTGLIHDGLIMNHNLCDKQSGGSQHEYHYRVGQAMEFGKLPQFFVLFYMGLSSKKPFLDKGVNSKMAQLCHVHWMSLQQLVAS